MPEQLASERRTLTIPAGARWFDHADAVTPHREDHENNPLLAETQWARCRSFRGQTLCSCGRYWLRWATR